MKKILKSKRGEGYIDVVVTVLVTMMLLIMALNIFSFFTMKQEMDYFAKEMVELAAAEGKTTGNINYRYYELCDETGIYPAYSWQASYYKNIFGKVQLGDTIKIALTHRTYVKGFGIFKIPVTLTVTHSGVSEHYWK